MALFINMEILNVTFTGNTRISISEKADLGSILLKLRLLALSLGSDPLEQWLKYETEGYPNNVEVPPYRTVGVMYKGCFSGLFNAQIQNAKTP